jgi:hypothetical protein
MTNELVISNENFDELYRQIKKHGYTIDVRDVKPTLRFHSEGQEKAVGWARQFETREAAIMFALDEIRKG